MKLILLCLCITLVKTASLRQTYQITFDGGETLPYAKLSGTIDRPLTEFTLCHWSKENSNNNRPGAVFSYNTKSSDNEILSMIQHNLIVRLERHASIYKVETNVPITYWLHYCGTWSTVSNAWQIFVNGERIGHGNGVNIQPPVEPNGIVILGQEQDSIGGGFDMKQSLAGRVSEVHLWDRILTNEEVLGVYKCTSEDGNVIGWNRAVWALYKGSEISPVRLPCGDPQ